jgi:uncharacterized protein YneF (UPF0154 family)
VNILIYVLVGLVCAVLGVVGGFFLAKKQMTDYLEKNPPVNEDVLRMMMSQMGQKPSEAKIRQMMQAMKRQQAAEKNKKKKK